jgi:hypothetical protein
MRQIVKGSKSVEVIQFLQIFLSKIQNFFLVLQIMSHITKNFAAQENSIENTETVSDLQNKTHFFKHLLINFYLSTEY